MPRIARPVDPGVPHHVVQRGNNRKKCFYNDIDRGFFIKCLRAYAPEHDCTIHTWVLMPNHFHLLATPEREDSLALTMKAVTQRYTQYINHNYKRTGCLWEGRYKSFIAADERYILSCYRYIELNPVRAKLVDHPSSYRWSSYRENAQTAKILPVTPHGVYEALGATPNERRKAYRELLNQELPEKTLEEIRAASRSGGQLGSVKTEE